MLKVKMVSKAFGNMQALDRVTFNLVKPCTLGLAGSSGSGKSTLLRLIQGLETPDTGSIETTLRTGFMCQDFQLFPHMTVWKNVIYAPYRAKSIGYITRAKELLAELGLTSVMHAHPHQLSSDQQQRVALVRSLMMQPEILLCDEPTSGLDIATTLDIVSLLESVKNLGIIIIIASHDLDFLTKVADKIIVLKAGQVVTEIAPRAVADPIGYLKTLY